MKRVLPFVAAFLGIACVAYGCGGSSGGAGPAKEAGSDVTSDVASHEAAAPVETGPVCAPSSISGFTPPPYRHARQELGACAPADITQFDGVCFNVVSGSLTLCNVFHKANPVCYACLVSNLTDTSWGPVVIANAVPSVNVAGCLELTDPAALACSQSLATTLQCQHALCDGPCPVTDIPSYDQWQLCAEDTLGTCGGSACLAGVDASSASPCLPAGDAGMDDLLLAVAPVFCGGTSDAGTAEGGGDGAADAPATD